MGRMADGTGWPSAVFSQLGTQGGDEKGDGVNEGAQCKSSDSLFFSFLFN